MASSKFRSSRLKLMLKVKRAKTAFVGVRRASRNQPQVPDAAASASAVECTETPTQSGMVVPGHSCDQSPPAVELPRRRRKQNACGTVNANGGRQRGGFNVVHELAGLDESEKRQRLLQLLAGELCCKADDKADLKWKMAELDEAARTTSAGPALSFDFRTCNMNFGGEESLSQLLRACRLVFALDGSSWMPCDKKPRCLPEAIAAAVFAHHTKDAIFDPALSGAEWWSQVRQSGHPEEAVQFHWDTDEPAVERHGANLHPHLATVTYLTDVGAPTLVLDRRNPVKPKDVMRLAYGNIQQGMLSHPRVGKHVVFDGQLLHGTVPEHGCQKSSSERVTLLVNVWLNHRPYGCHRAPKSLASRLGPCFNVTLSDCKMLEESHTVAVGEASGDEGYTLDTTFGRREHNHHLRVPLLKAPSAKGWSGETLLLQWPASGPLAATLSAACESDSKPTRKRSRR
eukprot:TRINITY_DN14441_c0_g1_i1.p1 TRINITY_DN14441_c0_g1~~TRINITY_DN14441_c0_g1_i1.p1  ORF type:complete len:457 (-),score=51.44 TRINITY_DN14441_c0_g1_i1:141-1511(-)